MTIVDNAFAPEFELVVACVGWPRDEGLIERTRTAAARVKDWNRFIDIVDRHRVAGLVSHSITEAGVAPPSAIATGLTERARENAVQEVRFVSETVRLTKLLGAADIPVSVLKGPTIALLAFGRFGMRYSMDIDLLVSKPDVHAARTVLEEAGYTMVEPTADAPAKVMRERLGRYKDLVFEHPVTGAIIELHWRLFQNPFLLRGAERVLAATPLTAGWTIRTLPKELFLLYLCAHGAEHAWARLKWLADLGAVLRNGRADPDELYASARRRGLSRSVGPGMMLCAELFDTPLPAALRRDIARDWRLRWLYRTARDSMVGTQDGVELEDRALGTTRKNLSHYLTSNDPRYWIMEARYDLLDGSASSGNGNARLVKLIGRLLTLLTGRAPPPAPATLQPQRQEF